MNSAVPPVLASYIQQCIDERSLTLLTSTLDTPANWLLTRFLVLSLQGSSHRDLAAVTQSSDRAANSFSVIFVSVFRPLDIWSELARKCGVNLRDAIVSSKLCYVDGLATGGNGAPGVVPLENHALKDLDVCLNTTIQSLSNRHPDSKVVAIFDGIDFLLASQPKTTSDDVQRMLLGLRSRIHSVVITCAADSGLLHKIDASATPLELEHTTLVRSLAHQTRWLFQLRPLETGQSKEVSGSVRVSKGGAWENAENAKDLDEGEWLFHVNNHGGVKVWGRGEA